MHFHVIFLLTPSVFPFPFLPLTYQFSSLLGMVSNVGVLRSYIHVCCGVGAERCHGAGASRADQHQPEGAVYSDHIDTGA
jgi:hypothetical protein